MKFQNRLIGLIGVVVGTASVAYAACNLTLPRACANGSVITNPCPYPIQASSWTYTLSAGPTMNKCVGGFQNGFKGCINDPAVDCIQTATWTACLPLGGQLRAFARRVGTSPYNRRTPSTRGTTR